MTLLAQFTQLRSQDTSVMKYFWCVPIFFMAGCVSSINMSNADRYYQAGLEAERIKSNVHPWRGLQIILAPYFDLY